MRQMHMTVPAVMIGGCGETADAQSEGWEKVRIVGSIDAWHQFDSRHEKGPLLDIPNCQTAKPSHRHPETQNRTHHTLHD